MAELLLRDVEVDGRVVDVAIAGGAIRAVAPRLPAAAAVLDGGGGALLPGLHDHHVHLLATAAAAGSVRVGPADVDGAGGLRAALRAAPGEWVRAVGYHERVAGDLDRWRLDALVPDRPVRVQHRSGARWTLNSLALDRLRIGERDHPGVERDARGRPTGRLHRADAWLATLLPRDAAPDLASLGARLARLGVTGVTDTTPYASLDALAPLADAVAAGALPQRVVATGGPALASAPPPPSLEWGPVKVVVDDAAYPPLGELVDAVRAAHAAGRTVAVHCVTAAALALALAAWDAAGVRPGDRVEHGSVVTPEAVEELARHGLTVVTQPAFVAERGDEYLADVDAADVGHLYRCRSLLDAGVPVAGSSDAPYADADPWAAMRAAVERRTPSGAVLGPGERVTPSRALALFLGEPGDPGGPARRVAPGAPADLCLLAVPRAVALERLAASDVRATIRAGRIVYAS